MQDIKIFAWRKIWNNSKRFRFMYRHVKVSRRESRYWNFDPSCDSKNLRQLETTTTAFQFEIQHHLLRCVITVKSTSSKKISKSTRARQIVANTNSDFFIVNNFLLICTYNQSVYHTLNSLWLVYNLWLFKILQSQQTCSNCISVILAIGACFFRA